MKPNTLSIVLLIAALCSLAFSHLFTFSFVLPKATRAIWLAHDVFEKNKKEKASETDYDRAYAVWLRDSTTVIAWAKSLHVGLQVLSATLFVGAFFAASKRPNPESCVTRSRHTTPVEQARPN